MPETKDDGIGVGFRPSFREEFLGGNARVGWIEALTENYFPGYDRARQTLHFLRARYPVALHGIGLNLASAEPLDEVYLRHLKALADEIQPWLVSDHLCWTGVGGDNLFDLLPFPFTREALELVAGKVGRVQDLLRRPVAVENITFYAHPRGDEMGEPEFLNELCARAGCRLLLDVNNVYVNGRNFGFAAGSYFSRLDLRHVAQVHLAGHFERRDGILIDTHGAPVKDAVWELYEGLLDRTGLVPTMIERDQNIPTWSEMERELGRLREVRAGKGSRAARLAEDNP